MGWKDKRKSAEKCKRRMGMTKVRYAWWSNQALLSWSSRCDQGAWTEDSQLLMELWFHLGPLKLSEKIDDNMLTYRKHPAVAVWTQVISQNWRHETDPITNRASSPTETRQRSALASGAVRASSINHPSPYQQTGAKTYSAASGNFLHYYLHPTPSHSWLTTHPRLLSGKPRSHKNASSQYRVPCPDPTLPLHPQTSATTGISGAASSESIIGMVASPAPPPPSLSTAIHPATLRRTLPVEPDTAS
ncbi:hypothetical protein PoB_007101100 [Plakobranchus ocellatus]|uniref:Uncharacterized protein n=1 Tax=Plakobranchus ocellatus TaxID=259542 RepID=A0AAV4DKV6_9GAST|nr:hypothetical protein PoB_007101100 [Plakobranchus ocellatus]